MLVSKEPNEEQRQEVAEAKPDNDAGTIKTGLAAICAVVAFACSVVGIWAAATEHYTTLITVVVGGIISFAIAKWLGWRPKQIRRTTDLLNKLSTLPLSQSVPPDEQSKAEQFEAQHDIVAKELVRTKLELERVLNEKEQRRLETTELQHNDSVDETPTEPQISALETPQEKISVVSQAEVVASIHPQLCEVKEQILRAIARQNGASEKRFLRVNLDVLRFTLQQQPLDEITIDYHLHELEELGFLSVARNRRRARPRLFSLTQRGRKYVLDYKLNDELLEAGAAVQRERMANAETALLELQERTRPRKLTPEQRDELIALLKQGPTGKIGVRGISDDSEVVGFVYDLASAVRAGGWTFLGTGTLKSGEVFTGLRIVPETPEGDPPTTTLQASLNAIGLSASLHPMPDLFPTPDDSGFLDDEDFTPIQRMLLNTHTILWVGFKP